MVNCNEYLAFEQVSGHTYKVTPLLLTANATWYVVKIINQSGITSIQTISLQNVAIGVSASFTLPGDGVYSFRVYNEQDELLFDDNVLHLYSIIECYYGLLAIIGDVDIAALTTEVCTPCAESDCDDCVSTGSAVDLATKKLSKKQAMAYINFMSPYLFKLMAAIVPERLAYVGLRPPDADTSKRLLLLKEAFSDIKTFTDSCGVGLCASIKATTNCDCGC